ncbi:glycosyl hydrolase family 92-domain-containing protein [Ochromonadaceae sp. CCMP2298]|nr:glycosyl hydrolase family 92-domain-containing protein [Ochromonadaceae sp. CCMP2298]
MMLLLLAVLLCSSSAFETVSELSAHAAAFPEEYVNTLGGTDSRYDLSHGSSLPLIALPWGFNTYAPQTNNAEGGWWFHPSDRRLFGLRVTHQPSPWISDYGNFLIQGYMPTDPGVVSAADEFTGYSPASSVFHPYLFETQLLAYSTATGSTHMSFAPTLHGGIMRLSFPKYQPTSFQQTRRVAIRLNGGADESSVGKWDGTVMLSGFTTANSGGAGDSFKHHFVACIYGAGDVPLAADGSHADGNTVWANFSPEEEETETLTVRFATSFISHEQALLNLREVGDFEGVAAEAKRAWREVLSRVKVTSVHSPPSPTSPPGHTPYTPTQSVALLTTFYSSLYRASLFPRILSETDASGEEVHWSPYTPSHAVRPGPLSTDSGFWDAWNTVYPLLTLSNPPMLGRIIQGWLSAYEEGGWLPKWASPGYRGSMVGTMGDVSLADAIVKQLPGFDYGLAYAAIRKDAFEDPAGVEGVGRECLEAYLEYGYVPRDPASTSTSTSTTYASAPAPASTSTSTSTTASTCDQVVSRTLNYYQADWAIAQAARKLGHEDDYALLMRRANNYTLLFDQNGGFFRSRTTEGKFSEPFDEFAWGGDYTEAGPWQYRFYTPYDPQGLAGLYSSGGGDMCEELEKVHTTGPVFHIGGYDSEIHEMTEMCTNTHLKAPSQYSHNNQPIHHQLYMYMGIGDVAGTGGMEGCAAKGQMRIRQVLSELYTAGSDMFPGDEDNGEMGAWYVLSALGLYNLSPGGTDYMLGSPLFGEVEVQIGGEEKGEKGQKGWGDRGEKGEGGQKGATLLIRSVHNSAQNVYVQYATFNDLPLTTSIAYSALRGGGTLTFYMGPAPP